jgi:hypothetical protein
MQLRSALVVSCLFASASFAADLPPIPADSIAKKGELLFSDDMNGTTHDPKWHRVVDTFTFEDGVLKGTQTRVVDVPAADGKPEVKAHPAVYGLELPTKNSVVEVKIRFEGNKLMDVEFDDRDYTVEKYPGKGSHYGHLCRAQVYLDKVSIVDELEGSQSAQMQELRKDPVANKDAIGKLYASHSANFPLATKLEPGKWYTLVVETVGEEMRVTIDGTPVAFFKSPGIGHEPKSKIELGVSGQSGLFDDIKVWNAEPAK